MLFGIISLLRVCNSLIEYENKVMHIPLAANIMQLILLYDSILLSFEVINNKSTNKDLLIKLSNAIYFSYP